MDDQSNNDEVLKGRETLPSEVRDSELQYIRNRRKAAGVDKSLASAPLVGLALSGGGIRSATFCLGILQALAKRGILKLVDFMCTVSGGGYIGSCLSSLMTVTVADTAREHDEENWAEDKRRYDMGPGMPFLREDQMHHLRRHGDFLVTRLGFFRQGVLRVMGYAMLGFTSTASIFASLLLAITGLLFLFGVMFGGMDLWADLGKTFPWNGWRDALIKIVPEKWSCLFMLTSGMLAGGLLSAYGLKVPVKPPRPVSGETPHERSEKVVLIRYGLCLGVLIITLAWMSQLYLSARITGTISLSFLMAPTVGFLGALLATCAYFVQLGRMKILGKWDVRHRSLLNAMQGICLYQAVICSVGVLMVLLIWWLKGSTLGISFLGVVAIAGLRFLVKSDGILIRAPRRSRQYLRLIWEWGPLIAVPLFIFSAIVVCAHLILKCPLAYVLNGWLLVLVLPLGLLLVWGLGMLIDYNRVSPHYFYRDRLKETYLVTQKKGREGLQRVRDDSDLLINQLLDRFERNGKDFDALPNPAPYHLIQCSLNLPRSRDLARRHRKSDHFIFSREYCGSGTTGYVPSGLFRDGRTKLSRAMAISGAAISSTMGFQTSFPAAFVTTLFNIRLGYWLENPRCYGKDTVYSAHAVPPRRRKSLRHPSENRIFWPLCLLRELTSSIDANGPYIHLSDGGHTGDNIGLYPLFQRRCRLIIACDGECDPEYGFGSLAAAIRQIYTDENVEVDIDLNRIRPAAGESAPRGHFVVGKIRYPGGDNEASGTTEGWLLYLKSSFIASQAPSTVQSYAAAEPDFPHQPTADQFFDDDQFEAYRALGEFIAGQMLDHVREDDFRGELRESDPANSQPLINWCRKTYEGYAD